MKRFLPLLIIVTSVTMFAQESDPWADAVVSFNKGTLSSFGQSSDYFPANILGAPDKEASDTIGSANPEEVCALGYGGEIVLEFTDNIIVNGPGSDFTVFENAFIQKAGPAAGIVFAEPAKVAVSKDGINFIEFPFDSLSLEGLAGKTPTNGANNPLEPGISGGDSFDLGIIGIDSVRFVKLTDVTAIVKNNPNHPYFNPSTMLFNGFDLDAVVAINSNAIVSSVNTSEKTQPKNDLLISTYPNPAKKSTDSKISVSWNAKAQSEYRVILYNIIGEKISTIFEGTANSGNNEIEFSINNLPSGVYLIALNSEGISKIKKVLITK